MKRMITFVCLAALLLPASTVRAYYEADYWMELPSGPVKLVSATAVGIAGSGMLIYGGLKWEGGSGTRQSDLYIRWGFDLGWQKITPENEPPPARDGHTAERVGDDMWVFGGSGPLGVRNDLWRYNIQENKWHEVTPANAPPPARDQHSMWVKDNKLYIIGGKDDALNRLKDTWYYDIATNTWHQVSDAPKAFSNAKAAVDKKEGLAYIFPWDTRMYIYNIDSDTWHQELYGPGAPSPRTDYALAQNEYRTFLIGGRDSSGIIWSSVYSFNFARSKWTKLANMPKGTAGAAAAVVVDPTLPVTQPTATDWAVLVYGGETATDPATDTLRAYIPNPTEETVVEPGGGTLEFTVPGGPTIIVVPADAVHEPTGLAFTPQVTPSHTVPATVTLDTAKQPASPELDFAGYAFTLEAYSFPDWELQPGFTFSQPVTITLHYTDTRIAGIDENTLRLYHWDVSQWRDAATTCVPSSVYDRHAAENWLAVPICQTGEFALLGERNIWMVYLPLVLR